ncbi:MAG: UDP-N-acetylmuramoyl-L-alanine--D-glutamate ligase [Eubacterium sp.]|nr:UDP-N-acetylmuramoyl-L-alanine--D-glutamate ligase [Eubacterium sp.]
MDLKDKKILIAGAGISGQGAACLLGKAGISADIYDGNPNLDEDAVRAKLPEGMEVTFLKGTYEDTYADAYDMLVISPGIPLTAAMPRSFADRNKPVWGEIELAAHFAKGRIAAITGTNGKTTTTALVGSILKAYYDSVFVVGNIGIPFTGVALETTEDSVIAAEISSFQLETAIDFRPQVSAVLNVTPDHLDRHGTMEAYADMKCSISKNQTSDQVMILNYDDPITRQMASKISARPVMFSRVADLEEGIVLSDGAFVIRDGGKEIRVAGTDEVLLPGSHNQENILAAIGITYFMGVPAGVIGEAVKCFRAVEHRIEYVDTVDGVEYYNDSKGTNPDAAIKGIRAMSRPTILIGGGYDKKSEYDSWIEAFDGRVRYLILMGQTADKIAETARAHGFTDIVMASDMEDALKKARSLARPGDAVLLSPACASWGMFPNYEVRGNVFKEIVRSFSGENA